MAAKPLTLWSGPQDIHPVFLRRLRVAEKELLEVHGLRLRWESGWRSSSKQKELYDCYQRGTPGCNPANPPGTSNHESVPWNDEDRRSLAVDVHPDGYVRGLKRIIRRIGRTATNADYALMQRVMAKYKIHFPISSEKWHAQPLEAPKGYWTGMPVFPRRKHYVDDDDR